MNNNLFFVTSLLLLIVVGFLLVLLYFIILHKNNEIRRLEKNNVSLILGERPFLSYKRVLELYYIYKRTHKGEGSDSKFLDKILPRVIYDIKRLSNYQRLWQYMSEFKSSTESPDILNTVHRRVTSSNVVLRHIRKLCTNELVRIKGTYYDDQRLKTLESFIKELSSPCLAGFPQNRNKQQAIKLRNKLSDFLASGKGVRSINIFGMGPLPVVDDGDIVTA